jgi:hypothetical protein
VSQSPNSRGKRKPTYADAVGTLLRAVTQLSKDVAELKAAVVLLLEKGVFTPEEFEKMVARCEATADVLVQMKRLGKEIEGRRGGPTPRTCWPSRPPAEQEPDNSADDRGDDPHEGTDPA